MRSLLRVMGALVLGLVAASSPVMGWAAAEHYKGRRFYGFLEGDWLFLFALISGVCCVVTALSLLRGLTRPA